MTAPVQPYRHDYLFPPPGEATVFDAMHAGVVSCPPDASMRDVAKTMAGQGVHAVLIEGIGKDAADHARLSWRVFTDLDLARAAADIDSARTVADMASGHVETIEPGAPLTEAARIMADLRVNHLLVVHDQRPIGILSTADVARVIAWSQP
jgi:CBS domain-containing protein